MNMSENIKDNTKQNLPDQVESKETTPTFTYLNKKTGLLEIRNLITGDLLAIQESLDKNILYAKEKKTQVVKINGKEVYLEAGLSADKIKSKLHMPNARWAYSEILGEVICQEIIEGKPITKLGDKFPPYPVICRWRKEYSSFNKMVNDAFLQRGEFHRDRVLEIVEEDPIIYDKNGNPVQNDDGEVQMKEVNHLKMQVDAHKWLASTDNTNRFGNKTRVDGEVEVKHTIFQIDTGIRRPGDPGYRRDETRTVQEIESKKIESSERGKDERAGKTTDVTDDVKGSSTIRGGDSFTLKSEESEASDGSDDLCGEDINR